MDAVLCSLRQLYEESSVGRDRRSDCSKLLYDLSKFYGTGDDKWSFIAQCALLNGALAGTDVESMMGAIAADVESLGNTLLRAATGRRPKNFNLFSFSKCLKHDIDHKRKEIAVELKAISHMQSNLQSDDDLLSFECETIDTVRRIMEDTTQFYSGLIQKISSKCVQLLGEPPCVFSHFAMGSLARREVTLYSDFENAIILGDNIEWNDITARNHALEYFRWYSTLFDLTLINFGETPISLIGIDGLNDHYSTDETQNWFYDMFVTCGIMFDSFLPYASKNPFGRKPTPAKPEGTELILPCDEMLEYLTVSNSLKEGYQLSNMLLESRHVAGCQELFNRFHDKSMELASKLRDSATYMQQDFNYTCENLLKFDLTPTLNTTGWSQHAKKSFYRPLTVHIPFVARICSIFGIPNTSDIIQNLKVSGCLSDKVAHNLLFAIATSNLIRMKLYSERSGQNDSLAGAVNFIDNTSKISTIFDAVGDRNALHYFEISLGLRNALIDIVDILKDKMGHIGTSTISGQSVKCCLDDHLLLRGNLKLFGDIYLRFQNYDKACQYYEEALSQLRTPGTKPPQIAECELLVALGLTSLHALKFENSLQWYKELIDLETKLERGDESLKNIATALTMSGQCYTEVPELRHGYENCIGEAGGIWMSLHSSCPDDKAILKGIADLRDTEAFYFLRTKDFESSLRKYTEAAKLFEQYFTSGTKNNDTIKVKNGIAMCLMNLERFDEAATILQEIIKFKRSMIGYNVADVSVSWYLRHNGTCLSNLGDYDGAVRSYRDSIKVRLRAPGSRYDIYAAVSNTHRLLSECHLKFGRYDDAISASNQVLELVKHIPGTWKAKHLTGLVEEVIRISQSELNNM